MTIVLGKVSFPLNYKKLSLFNFCNADYYEYLISLQEGGIVVDRRVNIQSLGDISDVDRGIETSKRELRMMLLSVKGDQKTVFCGLINEMKVNSVAFVSGAAGTGKSYVLRMLERYYRINGYKVTGNRSYINDIIMLIFLSGF